MAEDIYHRLLRHEGFRGFVCDAATGAPIRPGCFVQGHPTIGIGHALDINPITVEFALDLLKQDVAILIYKLGRFSWFNRLDEVRRDVVVIMAFNLGIEGFSAFAKFVDAIAKEDYRAAADCLLLSAWAGHGQRAGELAQAIASGSWAD